jgi:hypothetical protein
MQPPPRLARDQAPHKAMIASPGTTVSAFEDEDSMRLIARLIARLIGR